MKKKKRQAILEKVRIATAEVSDAASDLDRLLSELQSAPRAEKTTVSKVVEAAFARLKAARAALEEIETILAADEE